MVENGATITKIGGGSIGGKARGLVDIQHILEKHFSEGAFPWCLVGIPPLVVLGSDVFDKFMQRNDLYEIALSDVADDRITHAFLKASLPTEILGDLRTLCSFFRSPLAVRSSSMLEDMLYRPFAGIYGTKMIPNHYPDPNKRFNELLDAIKFVYSSTFFKSARDYLSATGHRDEDEKMAVIIQVVAGKGFGDRFYPDVSGVAKSFNYYPTGRAQPEDGVVDLALGLGKTIVDGGSVWTYSPTFPKIGPPFGSVKEQIRLTQNAFWAINLGKPPLYDPLSESEFLIRGNLDDAHYDNTLTYAASTYDIQSGRLHPGVARAGPKVVDFSMLLVHRIIPLNDLIQDLLRTCREAVGMAVEIEFAVTFAKKSAGPHRFEFLQIRPMVVSDETVEVSTDQLSGENVLLASTQVMGNGIVEDLQDVVLVKPERFESRHTPQIALELAEINRQLIGEGRTYLLIGFGRWGSSDPWLGIPVDWGQIGGARVIVEATLENMNVELSQGSHFFHNLSSFKVLYFMVPFTGKYPINWEWLASQKVIKSFDFTSHLELEKPLRIKADGRNRKGIILF